jgi:PPOX class probable F420-dependent enzyme
MLDATTKQLASEGRNFAALAIHLPSGQILNHVMWVDADDEHVLINTETHRAKYKAMTANPDVTVTIWNAENPYSYSEVRGKVVGEVRGDDARAHIDTLSQRYTGGPYQGEIGSERVIVRIAPVRQRGQ